MVVVVSWWSVTVPTTNAMRWEVKDDLAGCCCTSLHHPIPQQEYPAHVALIYPSSDVGSIARLFYRFVRVLLSTRVVAILWYKSNADVFCSISFSHKLCYQPIVALAQLCHIYNYFHCWHVYKNKSHFQIFNNIFWLQDTAGAQTTNGVVSTSGTGTVVVSNTSSTTTTAPIQITSTVTTTNSTASSSNSTSAASSHQHHATTATTAGATVTAAPGSSSTGGAATSHHRSSGASGGGTTMASASSRVQSRSRASDESHIGKYRLLKTIGKGNFAKVCVCWLNVFMCIFVGETRKTFADR
jgi:hypothetical protein